MLTKRKRLRNFYTKYFLAKNAQYYLLKKSKQTTYQRFIKKCPKILFCNNWVKIQNVNK